MRKWMAIFLTIVCVLGCGIASYAADPVQSGQFYSGTANVEMGMRNACVSPRMIELKYQKNEEDNGKFLLTFEVGRFPYELEEIFGAIEEGYKLPDNIDPQLDAFPVFEGIVVNEEGDLEWSKVPIGYVQDSKNGFGMMNCPQIFELPEDLGELEKGTLLCVGNSVDIANDLTPHTMDMLYSTDLGRTWKYYSTFGFGGKNKMRNTPLWEPHLLMYNGELHCYVSDETHPDYSQKLSHKSTKDGKVWSDFVDDVKVIGERPGMEIITQVETAPGEEERWALLYEAYGGRSTYLKFSNDPTNFDPWDEGIYLASGASPYIITLDTGALAYSRVSSTSIFVNSRKDGNGEWIEYKTTGVRSNAHNKQYYQASSGRLMILFGNVFGDYSTKPSSLDYVSFDLNTSGLFKDDEYVFLNNYDSSLTVSHKNGDWAEGNGVSCWTLANTWDKKFVIEECGEYVAIQGAYSGRYISVEDENSSAVYKSKKDDVFDDGQLFKKYEHSDGTFSLVSKLTGKALTIVEKGVLLSQTAYDNEEILDTQKFKSVKVDMPIEPYKLTVVNHNEEYGVVSLQGKTVETSTTYKHYVRIVPNEGYKISEVYKNGVSLGEVNRVEVTPTKGDDGKLIDQKVEAYFEKDTSNTVKTRNFSAFTTAGGSISPAEKGSMTEIESKEFTITPKNDYYIEDVTVNGVSVMDNVEIDEAGIGRYTVTNPDKSFKIIAYFRQSGIAVKKIIEPEDINLIVGDSLNLPEKIIAETENGEESFDVLWMGENEDRVKFPKKYTVVGRVQIPQGYYLDAGNNVVTQRISVDGEALAEDCVEFDINAIKLYNFVTEDISLPSVGEYGSSITWESSMPEVITCEGKVNRPDEGTADVLVELTAVAQYENASAEKQFVVKVLSKQSEDMNMVSSNSFNTYSFNKMTNGTVCFDLRAFQISDGLVALCSSNNTPNAWSSYNITMRLQPDGHFDAINGELFEYVDYIEYKTDEIYHMRVEINFDNQTYDVYVTDSQGKSAILAENFKYRYNAPAPADLGKVTVRGGNGVKAGLFEVRNFHTESKTDVEIINVYESEKKITATIIPKVSDKYIVFIAAYCGDDLVDVKSRPVELSEGVSKEMIFDYPNVVYDNYKIWIWGKDFLTPECTYRGFNK